MPLSLAITGFYSNKRPWLVFDNPSIFSRVCLRPLLSAPSERSWDTSFLFDHHKFLKLCPKAEDPFFSYLFDTQIFTAFVEQRSFAHSESTALVFFDECTEKVSDL